MFQAIDNVLFELINEGCHNAVFNFIMPIFSQVWLMWVGAAVCILACALHCWRSSLEPVGRVLMLIVLMGLSVGVTDFSSSALKHSIGRDRPCEEVLGANYYDPGMKQWILVTHQTSEEMRVGGSMPSAPAAACMAVAVVLSLLFAKANPWIFLLPVSVGFSQVYVGKNYPFDILVGWLLGLVSVIAVWWVCHLIIIRFSSHRKLG